LAAEQTGEGVPPRTLSAEPPPRRRRWLGVALPMLVVLIILLATLYLFRP
jgi:hypothetical protein